MKNIFLLFLASFSYLIATAADVELTCQVDNCEKVTEIHLYQFEGFGFTKLATASKNTEGAFVFKFPIERDRFVYLGNDPNQLKPILVGGKEQKLLLKGDCTNFSRSTIEGSALNLEYEKLKVEIGRLKGKAGNSVSYTHLTLPTKA